MGATARDVAALAGVSVFTVSRALAAGSTVSEATRARVLAAAQALGYAPRISTRAPSAGLAPAMGLVVRDAADPYTAALIRGVRNRANGAGYTVTVVDADHSAPEEVRDLLAEAEALVVATPDLAGADLPDVAAGRPVALVNHTAPDVPSVTLGYGEGVRQALTYLGTLGHRRVALVGSPASSRLSARWLAYNESFARSLTDVDVVDLGSFSLDVAGGTEAADGVAASGATAVCAYHDVLAAGLLAGLRGRGVDVPRQMSVVGAGEPPGPRALVPGLTAVSVPMVDAGRAVVDVLLTRLRDRTAPPAHHWDLAVHLVIGDSTAPAPLIRSSAQP